MKLIVVLLSLALVACGGGDPEEETVENHPPNCQANPQLCK